jgi:hypothetical protein
MTTEIKVHEWDKDEQEYNEETLLSREFQSVFDAHKFIPSVGDLVFMPNGSFLKVEERATGISRGGVFFVDLYLEK